MNANGLQSRGLEGTDPLEREQNAAVLSALHNFAKVNIGTILGDLSQSEYLLLFFVRKHDTDSKGVKVSKIASLMDISTPGVSRTLKSLEEKGYVHRVVDTSNRRNTYVILTQTGKAAYEKDSKIISDFSKRVATRIGSEKLRSIVNLSVDLYRIISEEITDITAAR